MLRHYERATLLCERRPADFLSPVFQDNRNFPDLKQATDIKCNVSKFQWHPATPRNFYRGRLGHLVTSNYSAEDLTSHFKKVRCFILIIVIISTV